MELAIGVSDWVTPVKFEPSPANDDAVIIPDAFIWLTSNPAECKFWVWNWMPWVCPSVSAVPTLIVLASPSITVELEPKVAIPVATMFRALISPVVILSVEFKPTFPVLP